MSITTTVANGHGKGNGHAKTKRGYHVDIKRVADEASHRIERLVRSWLPKGRKEGREWVALNPTRNDAALGSFKINLDTGVWCDFATGESGKDLVSLKAYLKRLSQRDAARLVADEIGLSLAVTVKPRPRGAHERHADQPLPGQRGGAVVPAPREASGEELRHSRHGLPSGVWAYYSADGAPHHMTARYETPAGKAFCPWHWTGAKWDYGAPAGPSPLYNLCDLIEHADAPVLVVEGEKAADAAAALFPTHVAVTSGGENSAKDADWPPLVGRRVVIWPDHDGPGARYAEAVACCAAEVGAASVAIVAVPEAWSSKWDLADAAPEGVTQERLLAMIERAVPWRGGAAEVSSEFIETLPLMRDPVLSKSYPIEDLGPHLAPVARAIARQVKVPEAMAGSCVLAAAALAAQGLADVELPVGGGLRCPLSLYFMAIAKSGARKSTAEKKANKGLFEWQKAAMRDYRVKLRAYKTAMKEHESGRKGTGKNGEDFYEPEPVEPVAPRLLLSDSTAEGFVKLVGSNNRPSLGLFTGEGGKFTAGYAMSDKAKGYSAAVYSTVWDDGSVDRQRATEEAGPMNLHGRRLSMHVLVQPDLAAAFLSDRALKDQGFLARFLICQPESLIGTRIIRDDDEAFVAADQAEIDGFAARMQFLLNEPLPTSVDEDGVPNLELDPRVLVMSREARVLYIAFCNEVEVEAGESGRFEHVSGFACKAAEHAGRIAGVLAILGDGVAKTIGQHDMARAVNLVRFHLGETERLQGMRPVDPELTDAERLLRRLREKWQAEKFAIRDVISLNMAEVATSRDAKRLLATLEEHGFVSRTSEHSATGRPLERFQVVHDS